jgi:ComF family protein
MQHTPDRIPLASREAQSPTGLLLSSARRTAAQLVEAALDLVFPPVCIGCGRVDVAWCARCDAQLSALPLLGERPAPPPLRSLAATHNHDGLIMEAVQALKYERAHSLARPLARRLYSCLQQQKWTIDMIAPIPLHISRLKARGYNQAQLLAEELAQMSDLPLAATGLKRQRSTTSQVGLTREQRQANVRGAFSADPRIVSGLRLLLIDDVLTTGATLQACAEAALTAGAAAVYGLTVTAARA